MSNEEIIQIFRALTPKLRGVFGREPFFQIFYDLQKNNPMMLQQIRENVDDLILFAIATRSSVYTELGIMSKNERMNLDYVIFNLNEAKLLEITSKDIDHATSLLNDAFAKNKIDYRVDKTTIRIFCDTIPKMRKIGQITQVLKMMEWADEIFACAGYVPRYLSMTKEAIASEGNLLSNGISDVKLSIINPRDAKKLCEDILIKTGHNRDSAKEKSIGQALEIAARQYIASQAVLGLKKNQESNPVPTKEEYVNMIGYIILSLKDWQNKD